MRLHRLDPFSFRVPRSRRGGFALISVLIVVALLSTAASAFLGTVRVQSQDAHFERQSAIAGSLAASGLIRIVAAFEASDERLLERLMMQPDGVRWIFNGQQVRLSAEPESARVDLNAGDPDLVINVMRAIVIDEAKTEKLIARLSSMRRLRRDLENVQALLNPEDRLSPLASKIEATFTVWTGLRGVDPMFAPEITLRSLPGLQAGEGDFLIRAQIERSYQAMSPFVARYGPLLQRGHPIYRIRSSVEVAGGIMARREAIILHDRANRRARTVVARDWVTQ